MPFAYTAAHTAYTTITSAKRNNLFYAGDTLTFTLNKTTATSYTVRDYWGSIVASGAVSSTTLTVPTLPTGWYRLYLNSTTVDGTWGTACGDTHFAVLRVDARFPVYTTADLDSVAGTNADWIWPFRGTMSIGPARVNLYTDAASPSTTPTDVDHARTYYFNNGYLDSARPRPTWAALPLSATNVSNPERITAYVSTYYPRITYFEGPWNEPNDTGATLVADMQAFYNAVKAGNASAQVMGPCFVEINPKYLDRLEDFLSRGGAQYVDAYSFHTYNSIHGDHNHGRKNLTRLQRILSAYGQSAKPIFITEIGFTNAADYGYYHPRSQAHFFMTEMLLLEQHGIPKERFSYFYDRSHGYWAIPSFIVSGDDSPFPAGVLGRVFAEEVYGKTFTARLDLGTHGEEQYLGSHYTSPSDGSQVLVLLAGGRTDGTVIVRAPGLASTAQVTCFGVTSTVTGPTFTLTVGMEPVYLRLPAGQAFTVDKIDYGIDRLAERSAAVRTSGLSTDAAATDQNYRLAGRTALLRAGRLENARASGGSALARDYIEYSASLMDDTNPGVIDLDLAENIVIDRVLIVGSPPYSSAGALMDFDVQVSTDGSTFTTVGTITDPGTVLSRISTTSSVNATAETFHHDRHTFEITFTPVRASTIRLRVRQAMAGCNVTVASTAAGGLGWGRPRVTAQAVRAFSPQAEPSNRRVISGATYAPS